MQGVDAIERVQGQAGDVARQIEAVEAAVGEL